MHIYYMMEKIFFLFLFLGSIVTLQWESHNQIVLISSHRVNICVESASLLEHLGNYIFILFNCSIVLF
jgi:hypothetical protein